MALTLKKLAIKDPDSTDMVILSNIMDGVDGSASFGWEQEDEQVRIEDNQTVAHSTTGRLDIKVLRASDADLAILDGLIGKPVEVSGVGITDFLIFRENPILNRSPDFNSAILNDRIYLSVKTPHGYFNDPLNAQSGSPQSVSTYYAGANAVNLYNWRTLWGKSPNHDDLWSGFTRNGIPTSITSGGEELTITTDSANGIQAFPRVNAIAETPSLFFPFPGETLTLAVDLSAAGYRLEFIIRPVDADGTIGTSSRGDFIQSGRRSATHTIGSGEHYFEFTLSRLDTDIEASATISKPSIRLNGKEAYTE